MGEVKAKDVSDYGGCFRKKSGSYWYLRVSESAVKFLKLDATKVYGVSHNGNITVVEADKVVIEGSLRDMQANADETTAWERSIGVQELSFTSSGNRRRNVVRRHRHSLGRRVDGG